MWDEIKYWLGSDAITTNVWTNMASVREWWTGAVFKRSQHGKAPASLVMLISWEVWKERNTSVFRYTFVFKRSKGKFPYRRVGC